MSIITRYSKVTLHFSLSVKEGDLQIDSTFDKQAATFVMGDGSLLRGFEACLLGLQVGDEKKFELAAADAFGEINTESIYDMEAKQFKDLELSEGLIVSFDGAGKRPMPGIVKKIVGEKITVDFNHPLAGQTILFKAKILMVENSTIVKQ